jgi:uncharacterized protein YaeQ
MAPMAQPSLVHRFHIDLSDSDRGIYQALEFRAARHPSESETFFAARVLAYCLNAQEGLEMTAGIASPEEPALRVAGPTGMVILWIDIGFPEARRLHKASKLGAEVRVYLHKEPYHYLKDLEEEKIHRKDEVLFFSFPPGFLEDVGRALGRDNRGSLVVTGGTVYLELGGSALEGEVKTHRLMDKG